MERTVHGTESEPDFRKGWTNAMDLRPNRPISSAAALLVALALIIASSPAPAAAQSACGGFYTLQTGDSLAEVAQRCGVTIPALLAANPGVTHDRDLKEGTRLRVPRPGARQPSPMEACGASYVVRPGDTLQEIALRCGVSVPLLIAANPPLPQPLGVRRDLTIRIPNVPRAAINDPATVMVAPVPPAPADTAVVDTTAAPAETAELTEAQGVLESGTSCMQVRSADGGVVAIAGEVPTSFRAGDQVVVMGELTTAADCGDVPTVELRIMYRAG